MSWSSNDLLNRFSEMGAAHERFKDVWNQTAPPTLVVFVLNLTYLFLLCLALAAYIDHQASARFRDAISDSATIRVLDHISKINGDEFMIDRVLDGEPLCKPRAIALEEVKEGADLHKARRAAETHYLPLTALARGAQDPAERILDSGVFTVDQSELIRTATLSVSLLTPDFDSNSDSVAASLLLLPAGVSIPDKIDTALGKQVTCCHRAYRLHGVLSRYTSIKLYYSHSFLGSLTRYDAHAPRVARVAIFFQILFTTLITDLALYSFNSNGIMIADATTTASGSIAAYQVIAVLAAIAISELLRAPVNVLIGAASVTSFNARYPLLAAECARRKAADMRAAVMSQDELDALVSAAKAAELYEHEHHHQNTTTTTQNPTASDSDGVTGNQSNTTPPPPTTTTTTTKPDLDSSHANSIDYDKPPSENAKAAAASLVMQNPSDDAILAIAAAPFLIAAKKATAERLKLLESSSPKLGEGAVVDVAMAQKKAKAEALTEAEKGAFLDEDTAAAVAAAVADVKKATSSPTTTPCCLLRPRVQSASAIALKHELARMAAEKQEKRAGLIWDTAQSTVNSLVKTRQAIASSRAQVTASIYRTFFRLASTPSVLATLILLTFAGFLWYIALAGSVQGEDVFKPYIYNWILYHIFSFLVLEPTTVYIIIFSKIVLWPALRLSLFSLPYGLGRILRRAVARSQAISELKTKNASSGNPAAVRAAAIAAHFPAIFAIFAYGAVLGLSNVASTAVDTNVAKALKTEDEVVLDQTILDRAVSLAETGADRQADLADAVALATTTGVDADTINAMNVSASSTVSFALNRLSASDRHSIASLAITKRVEEAVAVKEGHIQSARILAYATQVAVDQAKEEEEGDATTSGLLRGTGSSGGGDGGGWSTLRHSIHIPSSPTLPTTPPLASSPTRRMIAIVYDAIRSLGSPLATPRGSTAWGFPAVVATPVTTTTTTASGSRPVPPTVDLLNELTLDFGYAITGSLEIWRKENPTVNVARLNGRKDLVDADFIHLRGIKALSIAACNQEGLTNKAFENLVSLSVLNMSGCNQATITDAAFSHLRFCKKLLMKGCNQATITDKAFIPLRGGPLYHLDIDSCRQLTAHVLDGLTNLHVVSAVFCQPDLKERAIEVSRRGILPVKVKSKPVTIKKAALKLHHR